MTADEKRRRIESVPFWFHTIDCGDGVFTPGQKNRELMARHLEALALPPLAGKSVLDIGAWDGFYSFAAEERGARRVLALDHYVWSMSLEQQQAYYRACLEAGTPPRPYHLVPGHWQPGSLPGKRGFDLVHRLRGSQVEQLVADFMTVDATDVGSFDVVFFLGVLYHLEEPFRGLKRLSLFTRETAIIETAAVFVPAQEDRALFEFYEAAELAGDVGNWWAPNLRGLTAACRAAGFREVELKSPYPPENDGRSLTRYRLVIHAGR